MKVDNTVSLLLWLLSVLLMLLGLFGVEMAYFLAVSLCAFAILIKARISYFSIKTIVLYYVSIPVMAKYFFGYSVGILSSTSIPLYYSVMMGMLYVYFSINLFLLIKTRILALETKIIRNGFHIPTEFVYLFSILAMICIIIQFPYFRDFSGKEGMQTPLLPGSAWNAVSLVCLIFCLPYIEKKWIVRIAYLFVVLWCFLHFERVDALGILILVLFYFMKKYRLSTKWYVAIGVALLAILLALAYIGNYRAGGTEQSIFMQLLVQTTASDISYLYNIGFQYIEDYGFLFGRSLLSYFTELVPGLSSHYDISSILFDAYGHPGGQFLLSEPLMNFGMVGLLLFAFAEFGAIYFVLKKCKGVGFLYYALLVASLFRYCWYGIHYIETACVFIIPILYVVTKYVRFREPRAHCAEHLKGREKC